MNIAYLFFALSMLSHSFAQILMKKGLASLGTINFSTMFTPNTIMEMLRSPWIMGGIALSVLGLVMWLGALSNFKLNYLYALGSVTYIFVTFLSWWLLGESLTAAKGVGLALICSGIVCINLKF